MPSISRIISITFIISVVGLLSWLLFSGKLSLISTQEVNKSFSQLIALEGTDEYVVAQLVSNEEFTTETYNNLMGFPIGDTSVSTAKPF